MNGQRCRSIPTRSVSNMRLLIVIQRKVARTSALQTGAHSILAATAAFREVWLFLTGIQKWLHVVANNQRRTPNDSIGLRQNANQ